MRIWPALLFLLGPFLMSDVTAHLMEQGTATFAAKSPGPACGQYSCVKKATCNGQRCVCPDDNRDDGRFQCHDNKDEIRLEIVSNRLQCNTSLHHHDQDSNSVPIDWPCDYRLTRIQTKGSGPLDSCDLQVIGMNKLSNGRVVLYGVQLVMVLTTTDGDVILEAVRKIGSTKEGIYKYTEWGMGNTAHQRIYKRDADDNQLDGSGSGAGGIVKRSATFFDDEDMTPSHGTAWGQKRSIVVQSEMLVKVSIDADGFSVFSLEHCGAAIKFRATNEHQATVEDVPGLAIIVDKNRNPTFPDAHTYLGDSVCPSTNLTQRTMAEDLFLTVLRNGAQQEDTSRGDSCRNVLDTYDEHCSDREHPGIRKCHWIIQNQRLVKCMQRTNPSMSNRIMQLVSHCLRRYCLDSVSACYTVYRELTTMDCLSHWTFVRDTLGCPENTNTNNINNAIRKRSKRKA